MAQALYARDMKSDFADITVGWNELEQEVRDAYVNDIVVLRENAMYANTDV